MSRDSRRHNRLHPKLPGFIHHIALLWRLRMVMTRNGVNQWGQYGRAFSIVLVSIPSLLLGGFTFWFMSHPSISSELVVSQFYLNVLCFVTAMLWILWPVLSAGVEDGSERDRYLQFPISETRLLSASIISGVLKPVGFLMFAPLIGASIGYLQGQGATAYGAAFLLLLAFITMCATWSQAGVYLLRDILRAKSNGRALTLTLLVFIAIGMLLPQVDISWLYKQSGGVGVNVDIELEEFANIANAFSKIPPGYLGEGLYALVEDRTNGFILECVAMFSLALLGILNAKYRLQRSNYKSASYQSLQQHQWLIFSGRGGVNKVLAQRELFELWRNPRFRLLAIVPFFLIIVLRLVSADELMFHFFDNISQLWLMAGVGIYAAALILLTFTHNAFAYDGRGLLNLMSAPITPKQILLAKAKVHSMMSLCLGFAACIFYWQYVSVDVSVDWFFVALAGVFVLVPVVTSFGLWVSVHYPIKFDASLNRRERQPLLVSLASFSGVLLGALPLVVSAKMLQSGIHINLVFFVLVGCAMVAWLAHWWTIDYVSQAFSRREDQVLSAITRV